MERYVIVGGRAGFLRLQLLARDRWPDTRALLKRARVGPGMRCVDLGCGSGAVTIELARLVAPDGEVTGIDMDEVELALAREVAAERGITNVTFQAMNVNAWDGPTAYDVVYSRFVLHHLSRPIDMLTRMWAAVRPGGVVIVEDADFDGWSCYPANDGFAFFLRTYAQVLKRRGGDHATGRKLYSYFLDAGIAAPHVNLVAPFHISDEGKPLALSTLEATSAAILSEGLATAEELSAALTDLAAFTADPRSLITGPRIFQVWARR